MIYDLLLTKKIVYKNSYAYLCNLCSCNFCWFNNMLLSVINNYTSNHKSENFAVHETVVDLVE